jgi:hypothetical protein
LTTKINRLDYLCGAVAAASMATVASIAILVISSVLLIVYARTIVVKVFSK